MRTFTRKGYGRIYVQKFDDIKKVEKIIEELDSFEFFCLPEYFIALSSEYPRTVYTHKFCDLDIDKLTAECWRRGVFIWCYDAGNKEQE